MPRVELYYIDVRSDRESALLTSLPVNTRVYKSWPAALQDAVSCFVGRGEKQGYLYAYRAGLTDDLGPDDLRQQMLGIVVRMGISEARGTLVELPVLVAHILDAVDVVVAQTEAKFIRAERKEAPNSVAVRIASLTEAYVKASREEEEREKLPRVGLNETSVGRAPRGRARKVS